jgi:hypothetical protein
MTSKKLDAAGTIKLKILDEASVQLQRIHATVEQYAMASKREQPTTTYTASLRRQLPSLSEQLKGQFGVVAELVTGLHVATSRGSSEAVRVRMLREGVAQIRQALEVSATQVRSRHAVEE